MIDCDVGPMHPNTIVPQVSEHWIKCIKTVSKAGHWCFKGILGKVCRLSRLVFWGPCRHGLNSRAVVCGAKGLAHWLQ